MKIGGSDISPLSYSDRGKTGHAKSRLGERMPLENFPFSIRALNKLINRGKARIEKTDGKNKRIIFSQVKEGKGSGKTRVIYEVVVVIKNRRVQRIISAWYKAENIEEKNSLLSGQHFLPEEVAEMNL